MYVAKAGLGMFPRFIVNILLAFKDEKIILLAFVEKRRSHHSNGKHQPSNRFGSRLGMSGPQGAHSTSLEGELLPKGLGEEVEDGV